MAAAFATRPRVAVLEAVHSSARRYRHHRRCGALHTAGCLDPGRLRRTAGPDHFAADSQDPAVRSSARYEARIDDNHHHVVCRQCGTIGDVDCAIGQAPCLTPSNDQGFVVDEAEVIYWGLCPDCSATRTETA